MEPYSFSEGNERIISFCVHYYGHNDDYLINNYFLSFLLRVMHVDISFSHFACMTIAMILLHSPLSPSLVVIIMKFYSYFHILTTYKPFLPPCIIMIIRVMIIIPSSWYSSSYPYLWALKQTIHAWFINILFFMGSFSHSFSDIWQ